MPALRIKLPNSAEMTHHLSGECVTIGRTADNHIQIAHSSVSSHHAEIVDIDGHYCLRDLQSTNRSYVDGKPIDEVELNEPCKILFGSVECDFDPNAVAPVRRPAALPAPPAPPRPDTTFLENENRDLRDRVHALQRRFDILGSARLVTGTSDLTPYAAEGDALKSLTAERDELRQENTSLRIQLDRLRGELAVATHERDAARHDAEALEAERTALQIELKQAKGRVVKLDIAPPTRPAFVSLPTPLPTLSPLVAPRPGESRQSAICAPDADLLPQQIQLLREVVGQLSAAPAEATLLNRIVEIATQIRRNAAPLGIHAFRRVARALHELTHELVRRAQPPETGTVRTVRHTAEFLAQLLEPEVFAAGQNLAPGQVLAIDDDIDLLGTVTTALTATGLKVTGCESAETAIITVEIKHFDAIVADLRLPGMNGTDFCAHARDLPSYRRTPIVFLTVADTLDKRAETSLSGGNEFIAKPFNVHELALKMEMWTLKNQLQLL